MKKILCLVLTVFLCSCSTAVPHREPSKTSPLEEVYTKEVFSKGVWLSFFETEELFTSSRGFKGEFSIILANLKNLGITDLYLHVRSHCNAVYPSKLFPQTESSKALGVDPLEYIIAECHRENIRIHAWINPYRVSSSVTDPLKLPQGSPVLNWLKDSDVGNDKNVVIYDGIYLNPTESEVKSLIIEGVKELIYNYSIDGIHFDDYFYPTTDAEFDKISYENYKEKTKNPLSLGDFRRANVTALITECKTVVDKSEKDIVFSVSPSADIEKNYNVFYADIKLWMEKNYVDEIIPQIYFGFSHPDPSFGFERLLEKWNKLCKNSRVSMKIGLASYKIGAQSDLDGREWAENTDILSRQTKLVYKNSPATGVVYFSYSSLFSADEHNTKERNNLIGLTLV